MKSKIVVAALVAVMSMVAHAAPLEGWGLSGAAFKSYEIGEDSQQTISGKPARFIRYVDGDDSKFGTLMQQISANNYRGKRVRFQAMIKTRDVSQWAGLWMSAYRAGEKQPAVFYNSQDKPIVGSSEWQLRSVTLDLPEDAVTLNFGVIDGGKGQVWIDQLSLEVVGNEVPVDVMPGQRKLSQTPSL
ncbi:transcriptional regulator [Duganella sp. sic0402]|uniref:transcriptional regulator n=1 Tax=Duganella sp. sic0402 TaxID=2854786 RepID=UPI001C45896A|nr:transcriptional regulator [Duganella sp. sic0402]MBV7538006.1 transcriptional regulator [Duganella sp. sic0402]